MMTSPAVILTLVTGSKPNSPAHTARLTQTMTSTGRMAGSCESAGRAPLEKRCPPRLGPRTYATLRGVAEVAQGRQPLLARRDAEVADPDVVVVSVPRLDALGGQVVGADLLLL